MIVIIRASVVVFGFFFGAHVRFVSVWMTNVDAAFCRVVYCAHPY